MNCIYFTWKREKYLLHGNAGDRSLMRPPCKCVFSCCKDENQHGKKGEWEEQGDVPLGFCNTATHLWPSTVRLFHRRGLSSCNKSAIRQKTATVWWWSTKRNCLLFILYNVLIMLTLIMGILMNKWWRVLTQCKSFSIFTPSNRRHWWVKILGFKRHLESIADLDVLIV